MKVLFVCSYNTGRSQMAAALYNKLTKTKNADSAGTITDNAGELMSDRAKYRPAAQHVIKVIADEGMDISNNSRDLLTEKMIDKYDKVIVMAEKETIPDYLKNSPKFIYWVVEDPQGGEFETVSKSKDIIKAKVQEFIKRS